MVLAGSAALALSRNAAAAPVRMNVKLGGKPRLRGAQPIGSGRLSLAGSAEVGVSILTLHGDDDAMLGPDAEIGASFDGWSDLDTGVQLWRYAPWTAWTRPRAFHQAADLYEDDVQLLYWREGDGSYGVAVPLSGAGFRTTLGRVGGRFAARAAAGAAARTPAALPLIAIGHGTDAHATIAATYRAALTAMGRAATTESARRLPAEMHLLGWNSWNASDLGKALNERLLLDAAREMRGAGVPIGWMTVDDGYFDHREQRLRSFTPDSAKFPRGFAPVIAELRAKHGIKHVGAWLAIDGYWHGIDPASPLGREYAADLFTWTERSEPANPASTARTNSFIRPDRGGMRSFYDAHLASLRSQGFDVIKVDNQLVVERMARLNFPIWTLATVMHDGINAAAARHFGNAMINCMDLTADAYFNFGTTPVARAVEDYFPYKPDETYDLEKGNAAAHVLQAVINALYVGQLAIPDFDMFESTNLNARMHAVARTANAGPIYVTDIPGSHDVALLASLTLSDGRTLRADTALVPCPDSLFQLQSAKPFKTFSHVGATPLLAIFNVADADRVRGDFAAADVPGFRPSSAAAYEHLSGRLVRLDKGASASVELPRFGAQLWSLHDAADGFAAFGRSDKINGVAALAGVRTAARHREVVLHEIGPIAAFCEERPQRVSVDGRIVPFEWSDGLLRAPIAVAPTAGSVIIEWSEAQL
jgi:hypothetical protein